MQIKTALAAALFVMSSAFIVQATNAANGILDKYSDGKLTVEWTQTDDNYNGTIILGTQHFAATAHSGNGGITGSFASGGNRFPFTGSMDADTLTLTTGGTTYVLKKQSDPVNPLAAPSVASAAANALPGYTDIASTDFGKTLSTQKEGVASIQAALEATFPDLTRYFGVKPVIGSSYQDAKDPKSGGATFSSTLNGQPVKGIVSCKLSDKGAAIAVIYARADTSKMEWDKLMAPPPQNAARAVISNSGIPMHEYDFPDGTGSIGLAEGWVTDAKSVLHRIIVVGPDHQKLDLADNVMVNTEDSPAVQFARQSDAVANQNQAFWAAHGTRPTPAAPRPPMLIAPYAAPVEALKNLLPQFSKLSEYHNGPSFTLEKIISSQDAPAAVPNDKAAIITYTYIRTANGQSTRFRCELHLETGVPAYGGKGIWVWAANSLHAPDDTFDRDKPVMTAMGESVKVNMDRARQVNDAENQQLIQQNAQIVQQGQAALQAQRQEMQQYHDQRNADYQASREAQMESFADHNQQWAAQETQKQRANADFIEQIQGTRTIYDTQTGAVGSANLNDATGVVNSLNQAALDPNRFVQVPLRDYLYAPTPAPSK